MRAERHHLRAATEFPRHIHYRAALLNDALDHQGSTTRDSSCIIGQEHTGYLQGLSFILPISFPGLAHVNNRHRIHI